MPLFNTYIDDQQDVQARKEALIEGEKQDAIDQQFRRNVQWGIVRGMFLYTLLMTPVVYVITLIYAVANSRR